MQFYYRFWLCGVLWCISVLAAHSQTDSVRKAKIAQYIIKFDTLMSVRMGASYREQRYEMNGPGYHYDVRPNVFWSPTFFAQYRFAYVGFSVGSKRFPGNSDSELKGRTHSFRLHLVFQTSHILQELTFSKVRGFYLYNTGDYIADWTRGKDLYITFPDQRVISFSGSTAYKFNPKFSLRSITNQSESQLKSSGSLILFLDYTYLTASNAIKNGTETNSKKTSNLQAILALGYYYNLVLFSHFYLSAGLTPGAGYTYQELYRRADNNVNTVSHWIPTLKWRNQIGIGCNFKRIYIGAEYHFSKTFFLSDEASNLQIVNDNILVFVGHRFRPPMTLKDILLRQEKKTKSLLKKFLR
jgi:hypothetical protein